MSYARSYHSMVKVGTKLFVCGGVNYIGDDVFEDIKVYGHPIDMLKFP